MQLVEDITGLKGADELMLTLREDAPIRVTRAQVGTGWTPVEKSLKTFFSQQIQQKLKTLSYLKSNLQQILQQVMAANLLNAVLVKIKNKKQAVQISPIA